VHVDRRRSALLAVVVAGLVVLVARPSSAATGPDPRASEQWGLLAIKAPETWVRGKGGGVNVAIVSTGIARHDDLEGKVDPGFDATLSNDPRKDTDGRGTHLAGIVGAATNNGIGIAGVAPDARLLPYKAFESGSADDTYVEALNRARGSTVILVDLPVSYTGSTDALRQALRAAGESPGVSVVVGAQAGLSLGDLPVLTVAATTRSGSQTGAAVGAQGVAAPGQGILSTKTSPLLPATNAYGELSGTGQAAAHVAGALAILRGLGASAGQAADLLRTTAHKGGAGLGAGLIDVAAAAAAYQATPPAQASTSTTKKGAAKAAPKPTVTSVAPVGPPVSIGPVGPAFSGEAVEPGTGEETVVPPGSNELAGNGDQGRQSGPSILIRGHERPWWPLSIGFGLLFGVASATSLTFRRLASSPT